jgi:hypothetical protein
VGQLHKIGRQIIWVLAAVLAAGCPAIAQRYCSLTVRVLSPDGRREDALVSVEEKNGRLESLRQGSTDVRFCDLGAIPVTVKVGVDGTCNQVVVRNVPVAWNAPVSLTITYDIEPCLVEAPPPPSRICRMVFRVADTVGKWIPGIPITIASPMVTTLRADDYGRASFVASPGDRVSGSVDGQGYEPVQFSIICNRSEPVHEEVIRLIPKR